MNTRPSTTMRIVAAVATVIVASTVLASCGSATQGLFKTTCDDRGKRPSNLEESTPVEVIVLADVYSNDAQTAQRIADDTSAVVDQILAENDDLVITGLAAGGNDESITKIDCMDSHEYFFGGGNERRQETERKELKNDISTAIRDSVRQTPVAPTGDSRVLLRKVPTIATAPGAKVLLWSSFLEQGADCLAFEETDTPSAELAELVAQRCADEGLLPDLSGTEVTIVGAGSGTERPELSPFGRELASALCARMTDNCDVR